ncbi:MAG: hypothetical protein DLM55_11715 [Acidimicrobiales bacterium]|nr:MAG: hypothetical protein DLM55_11715 [Acidimicrobiales bacterium]
MLALQLPAEQVERRAARDRDEALVHHPRFAVHRGERCVEFTIHHVALDRFVVLGGAHEPYQVGPDRAGVGSYLRVPRHHRGCLVAAVVGSGSALTAGRATSWLVTVDCRSTQVR